MAKTETNVSTLKINRGTYAKVQENLSSITENELIITSDKNVPIPTTNDNGKAVVVNASGEYELGNAGMSQSDADARYLKLSGGTLTGSLSVPSSNGIVWTSSSTGNSYSLLQGDSINTIQVGNNTQTINLSSNYPIMRKSYLLLDTQNTSANPTLSGGEATLSSLKINDTNYAVGGTEVVANPTLAGTEGALTGLQVGDTKYKVNQPHTINTYTTGTLSEADQAKMAEDIAQGFPIQIGQNIYIYWGGTNEKLFVKFTNPPTSNDFSINIANYNNTSHQLSISSTKSNLPINSEIFEYSNTFGALLTKLIIGGQDRVFGAMSTYALTTAPTSANNDGGIRFVVLTAEPSTRYNGYLYIITA